MSLPVLRILWFYDSTLWHLPQRSCFYSEQVEVERDNRFPWSIGCAPVSMSRKAVGLFSAREHWWLVFCLSSAKKPRYFSAETDSLSTLCCCQEFFLLRCRTWYLSLLDLRRLAHFSGLLWSLWMVALLLSTVEHIPLLPLAWSYLHLYERASKSLIKTWAEQVLE